ncbi:MAG: pilus assembly protein PilM [Chitinispirillaceae bacterium]|nr:pilus assembly protein PilM [Chitinispirillaceae bacterium]
MEKIQNYISGLDIQSDYMSLAGYDEKSNTVVFIAIQPLNSQGNDSSIKTAKTELGLLKKQFGFPDTFQVNCSVVADYAIVKKFLLPSNEKDIEGAIKWELSHHILDPLEEYLFDFEPLNKKTDDIEEYLLVAYKREYVENLLSILKSNKILPKLIDVDIFALINVFEANYPELQNNLSILLHGENTRAKIVLTYGGKYVNFESIDYPQGIEVPTFCDLIRGSIEKLSTISSVTGIERIPILGSGGIFTAEDVVEGVKSSFSNFTMLNPIKKIGCHVGVEKEQLFSYLPQLAVAIGLALRGKE